MATKAIELLKSKVREPLNLQEEILDLIFYVENIENSELSKKIMSFENFREARKDNPESKFVDNFII